MEHKVYDAVFDLGQHVAHKSDGCHGIHYQLTKSYSNSNFNIDKTTGELFINRAVTPAEEFSIHVTLNYSVILKILKVVTEQMLKLQLLVSCHCMGSTIATTHALHHFRLQVFIRR